MEAPFSHSARVISLELNEAARLAFALVNKGLSQGVSL